MSCTVWEPAECASAAASSALKSLADAFAESAGWAVKTMTTAWLGSPSPDLTSAGSAVGWLSDRLAYFVLVGAFVSILWAAFRLAASGQWHHLGELGMSLGRLIVLTGCATVATSVAVTAGDAYVRWILGGRTSLGTLAILNASLQPGILLVVAMVVIVAQLVQLVMMLARNAMIIGLVAFLPVAASASNTAMGRQATQKTITWLAAFVLYKPVAATIYALAFRLAGGRSFADQMSGIVFMVLAILALPALMRLFVPVTASLSGGNAGAIAGTVVGAGIATGAVIVTGGAAAGGFAAAAPSGASVASGAIAPIASGAVSVADSPSTEEGSSR